MCVCVRVMVVCVFLVEGMHDDDGDDDDNADDVARGNACFR